MTDIAIQNILMGYRSTPHPATGYTPYEALMRRTVRTKLDFPRESQPNISKMEKEITDKDKEYKKKWDNQNRHPKTRAHNFKIGEKVLLKKKKENKWSPAYEREHYIVIRINGSSIQAQRKSDGRVVYRDASKFKRFFENNDGWRERLLRIPEKNQIIQDVQESNMHSPEPQLNQTNLPTTSDGTDNQVHKEPKITQRPAKQTRELPKRLRRLPSRFKDYILDHKK